MPNPLQIAAMKAAPQLPYSIASKKLPINVRPGSLAGGYSTGRPSIASTEASNPFAPITVENQQVWTNPDNTPQLLRHEMSHQVQKQWAPKILQSLPPVNPNDPYGGTDTADLKRIGGDPTKLSVEQSAAVEQKMQAMEQNGEKIDPIYQTFDRKFGEVPLSVMQPTDPNQKGINTMPRDPGLPPNQPWLLGKLQAQNVIPVKPGSGQDDPYASIAQSTASDSSDPYAAIATDAAAPPRPGTSHPELANQGPVDIGMGDRIMRGVQDLGTGALKGVGHTLNSLGKYTPFGSPFQENQLQPNNTLQKVGRGVEQAGEFLAPGLGEEAAGAKLLEAAPRLGEAAAPLARIGTQALGSGAINKLQGGGFGTGAAVGAAGAGIGEGMKAVAPGIAEGAMKIRKLDRAYGRTPGRAILDETTGIRPGTVAESAQDRLDELNPELSRIADRASITPNRVRGLLTSGEMPLHQPHPYEQGVMMHPPVLQGGPILANLPNPTASLRGARSIVGEATGKATQRNAAKEVGQLHPLGDFLSRRFDTGDEIPENVTPSELLNLRRGFGSEFVHNWNPETMPGVTGTARNAYHALSSELHNAVPETAPIDRRISSLIPVAKRAASTDLNADTGQRILGRIGAHTGAATLGGLGAVQGYRENGVKGGILGGIAGIAVPELMASPTGQMAFARALNTKIIPKLLTGSALQATH